MHCPGCADATALRKQLGRVSNEVLRLTDHVAHLGMDLTTAEALALTNGEARGRAEAQLATLRNAFCKHCGFAVTVDVQEVVAAETRAIAAEAERDELRGLLERWNNDELISWKGGDDGQWSLTAEAGVTAALIDDTQEWLASHPAIPEGTPGEGKGRP